MNQRKRFLLFSLVILLCITTAWIFSINFNHGLNAQGSEQDTTKAEIVSANTEQNSTTEKTYNAITSIRLSSNILSITQGKRKAITAAISYEKAGCSKNEKSEWISKNTDIVTVSKKGIIKAIHCGSTYIICSSKSGAVKARCKVTVREPYNAVKSLSVDKTKMRMNKKDARTINTLITYSKKTSYAKEPLVWTSSNNRVATVNKNGVVKAKTNGSTTITVRAKYSNKKAKCKVTVKKTKYIAFTFDDGPGIYTDKLLDALDKYHAKATFFIVGNRVNNYKSQLKREYSMGMEIGSHSYSHQNLKTISKKRIKNEIKKASEIIEKVTGAPPTLLRPPYGNYNATVSKYAGVPMVCWTVDTLDWKLKNTKKVCKSILNSCNNNSVILLHDIHSTSVDGFIKVLPKLKKKDFELVTVSELYQINGKKMKKGVMYYGPDRDR